MDFESLSDADLRQELISRGVNMGPITPSTRSLYVKKLQKLLRDSAGGDAGFGSPIAAAELHESHSESIPVPVATSTPAMYPSLDAEIETPRQRRHHSPPKAVVEHSNASAEDEGHGHESDGSDYEGQESVRILTPEEMRAGRTSVRRSPVRGDNASTFGMVSKVFVIILVVVFLFFVMSHVSKINTEGNQEPV